MKDETNLKMYSIKEVSELIGISPRSLYTYINQGKIKAYKLPTGWRFYEKDVIAFVTLYKARATRLT